MRRQAGSVAERPQQRELAYPGQRGEFSQAGRVGDPFGQEIEGIIEAGIPCLKHSGGGRPRVVILRSQHRLQEPRLDHVKRLVGPERFQQVVLAFFDRP